MSTTSTQQQWFVVVNPASANGRTARTWESIAQKLTQAGIPYTAAFSQRKGHSMVLTREAIRAGYRKIIAVGGDGTNNEVANGIMKQDVAHPQDVTMAVIPVGTGNDWIRTHNIPKNIDQAIALIKKGNTTLQDVGLVSFEKDSYLKGNRYFINVAGVGFDAFVTHASNHQTNFLGSSPLFYMYLVAVNVFKYTLQRAKLTFDKTELSNRFYTINVGICKYSGGGMQIVPQAVHDDGKFALTYATDVSKWEVIKATPLFRNGKIGTHPKITTTHARYIKIESIDGDAIGVEVDGEYLGETPIEFHLYDKALRVVVP